MDTVIHGTADGVTINVRVTPRASRSAIVGVRDGALLVRLNAPPVDGAANAELIEVLADALDVPRRSISITLGDKGRRKTVLVRGLSLHDVQAKLQRTI
jgi:uncharacterized protein (TIGR00251 family)